MARRSSGRTEVELQILVRRDGVPFLRPITVDLLREVERGGSLRSAAKGLKCSYQHAWDLIDEVNHAAPEPVVMKHRGGVGGGGAELSAYGRRILREYGQIEDVVRSFGKKLNAEMNF